MPATFTRIERPLTDEEKRLLAARIEVERRSTWRMFRQISIHGIAASVILALFAYDLRNAQFRGVWEGVGMVFRVLILIGAIVMLIGYGRLCLDLRRDHRKFHQVDADQIREAVAKGDGFVLEVETDDVVGLLEIDGEWIWAFLSLGDEGTLVVIAGESANHGPWPARSLTLVSSPHYGDWHVLYTNGPAPKNFCLVECEDLPRESWDRLPKTGDIMPGSPADLLRDLGYKGPFEPSSWTSNRLDRPSAAG